MVDLEQFREAVECLCNGAGSISSAEWARRDAERKRLLALIDNAGKVETAGVPTDGGLAQRGEAWLKVAQALNWHAPWWLNGEGTGREKAVAAIKKMAKAYGATQPAPVVDDAMRGLIEAAEHGCDQLQRALEIEQECTCEPCPQCGRDPNGCSETRCAETCACILCDHCCFQSGLDGLTAALAGGAK